MQALVAESIFRLDIRKSVYFYDDEHFKKVLILELIR